MEYVGFDRDKYKSFKNIKDSRRLHMLNLIKLKEKLFTQMALLQLVLKHTCVMEKKVNQFLKDWEDQLYGEETC